MEAQLLGAAVAGYGLAGSFAVVATVLRRRLEGAVIALLAGGLVAHTASLALRWDRVGHGPFISMFEVLSSNVWSLTLVFLAAYLRVRAVRPAAAVALPFIFVLMAWMLVTQPDDGHFPATYRTLWLYAHVAFGKVFLGSLLVAAAVGVLMLSGPTGGRALRTAGLAGDAQAEQLALRFLSLAFVFESLMLVTGAIWAQDAWGRYWAWDPLETWSFLTWLSLAGALHARFTLDLAPRVTALAIIGVFALAVLTFFGLPFVSTALHKGAI